MSNKCKRCGIAGGSHVHCANELWAERDKFKALLCDDDDENAVTCDTCHLTFRWDPDTERPATVCQWCFEKEQLEAERDELRTIRDALKEEVDTQHGFVRHYMERSDSLAAERAGLIHDRDKLRAQIRGIGECLDDLGAPLAKDPDSPAYSIEDRASVLIHQLRARVAELEGGLQQVVRKDSRTEQGRIAEYALKAGQS